MKEYVTISTRYKSLDKAHADLKSKLFEGDCAKFALQAICEHHGMVDMADIKELVQTAFDDFSCDNGWCGYQSYVEAMGLAKFPTFDPFAAPDEYTREFKEAPDYYADRELMLDSLIEINTAKGATPEKTLEAVKAIASETLSEVLEPTENLPKRVR